MLICDVYILLVAIKVGEPRPITVVTSSTGKPDAPCCIKVTNPRGQTMELPARKIPEGYTATLAPSEVGPHRVNVDFNGKEVPKSPFNVMAEPAIDFNKVKVTGLEQRKFLAFLLIGKLPDSFFSFDCCSSKYLYFLYF